MRPRGGDRRGGCRCRWVQHLRRHHRFAGLGPGQDPVDRRGDILNGRRHEPGFVSHHQRPAAVARDGQAGRRARLPEGGGPGGGQRGRRHPRVFGPHRAGVPRRARRAANSPLWDQAKQAVRTYAPNPTLVEDFTDDYGTQLTWVAFVAFTSLIETEHLTKITGPILRSALDRVNNLSTGGLTPPLNFHT